MKLILNFWTFFKKPQPNTTKNCSVSFTSKENSWLEKEYKSFWTQDHLSSSSRLWLDMNFMEKNKSTQEVSSLVSDSFKVDSV